MKKQLEKELQELAENIISAKGNFDLPHLKKEIEKLLEKVTILSFVEKYYNAIGSSEDRLQYTMKKVADFIEDDQNENDIFNLPVKTTQVQQIVITQTEKKSVAENKAVFPAQSVENNSSKPIQQEVKEAKPVQEIQAKVSHSATVSQQNSAYKAYQDIIQKQHEQVAPITEEKTIEKVSVSAQSQPETVTEPVHQSRQPLEDFISQTQYPVFEKKEEVTEVKSAPSLNDRFGKTAQIGLNDRLAFIRQLFFGSESEYNNVVQHINNLQSVQDIAIYIEQEVKPIYNHWRGKEDYEERFLSLMLKRFEV